MHVATCKAHSLQDSRLIIHNIQTSSKLQGTSSSKPFPQSLPFPWLLRPPKSAKEKHLAKAVLLFCHCLTDSRVSEIEPPQISSRPACWLPLTLAGKTANDPWLSALPTLFLYVLWYYLICKTVWSPFGIKPGAHDFLSTWPSARL